MFEWYPIFTEMTVAQMRRAFQILQPEIIMYGLQKFDNSKFREDLLLRLRNTDTEGSDTSSLDIL